MEDGDHQQLQKDYVYCKVEVSRKLLKNNTVKSEKLHIDHDTFNFTSLETGDSLENISD